MYNNSTKILGNKKCPSCQQTLDVESCFEFQPTVRQYKHICKKCDNGLKAYRRRQTSLSKATNIALHKSHERMLNNALAQKVEVTCLEKLREMYPCMTDHQITRMSKLNEKINAANDFLIEEQYYWLNPEERPAEGIEYRADLFDDNTVYETDKEELSIIDEQKEI
tara:strand:- start:106 stop:603 length:498 start_codon:yes stop_codon:yes gene_type:complete